MSPSYSCIAHTQALPVSLERYDRYSIAISSYLKPLVFRSATRIHYPTECAVVHAKVYTTDVLRNRFSFFLSRL